MPRKTLSHECDAKVTVNGSVLAGTERLIRISRVNTGC